MSHQLKFRELPQSEQPTYRANLYGVAALNNSELLSLVYSFTYCDTATELLASAGSLSALNNMAVAEMSEVAHVGPKAAMAIKAAFELGRRQLLETKDQPQISSPSDVATIFMSKYGDQEQEHFSVMLLDTKNKVIAIKTVYVGSTNTIMIRIGEIFREAVRHNAVNIIMCHNHPSGDPTPSPEDVRLTRQIVEAGQLLDIDVLDHIIVSKAAYVSLKERGLGFN